MRLGKSLSQLGLHLDPTHQVFFVSRLLSLDPTYNFFALALSAVRLDVQQGA